MTLGVVVYRCEAVCFETRRAKWLVALYIICGPFLFVDIQQIVSRVGNNVALSLHLCIGIVRASTKFTKILVLLTTIIKCGVADRGR